MKHTPEIKEEMKRLFDSGMTRKAIAEHLGIPFSTVRNITADCHREAKSIPVTDDNFPDEWKYYTAMVLGRKIYKDVYEEWDALNKKYGRASA